MKIVVAASNGFVGKALCSHFQQAGHNVIGLARKPTAPHEKAWDGRTIGPWKDCLESADVLINLAGKSVNCRYTEANKALILSSRIESTLALGLAITACKIPPAMWLNASAATLYSATSGDSSAQTETGKVGSDFSMSVAKSWEAAQTSSLTPKTITSQMRLSIVHGAEGGAFPVLSSLAKKGLNTKQGSGAQWISWIHIEDVCRAIDHIIDQRMEGPVNLCAPNPIQNQDYYRLLRKHLKQRWALLPQPEWLLKMGAFFMGTETELILKSRKVVSSRLAETGFKFKFEHMDACLSDLTRDA